MKLSDCNLDRYRDYLEGDFQRACAVKAYTEAQVRFLLVDYRASTPYPHARGFTEHIVASEPATVPDDLLARAMLQTVARFHRMVEEIQVYEAAWCPTPETEARAADLREWLEAWLEAALA